MLSALCEVSINMDSTPPKQIVCLIIIEYNSPPKHKKKTTFLDGRQVKH